MSILDVKRTKEDFLKHKSKSSPNTLVNYTFIFKSIEKFCIQKYNSSLEDIIEELAVVNDPQEQVESILQNYIDELELEGKSHSTVSCYSCIAKNYLKYRRVKFDKDELETCLNFKKERQSEKYPLTKEEIKTLLDHASFESRAKILLQSGSGFRISELITLRKSDINTDLERYTATIRAENAKNGIERTTIISSEAMSYLDKILKNKNDNDLIFYHNAKCIRNAVVSEIETFDRIRKSANLDMTYDSNKRHKITTHSFRAFFISQFEKTYSGFGHVLSGHGKYMKQYERFTIGEKIEKYIETEKYLLIYSKPNESTKELLELKAKVSRLEQVLSQKGINLNELLK